MGGDPALISRLRKRKKALLLLAGAVALLALLAWWTAPAIVPPPALAFVIVAPLLAALAAGLVETYRAANPDHATITVADKIPYARLHPPERLDYIFARSGAQGSFTVARSDLALTAAPEPNPDQIPGFSDHYGVRSELELTPAPAAAIDEAAGDPVLKASLARALRHGIRHEKAHRRNAGLLAAAASLASATLLSPGRGRPGGRGIVRILAGATVAALLVTGGLNLSTVARLDTEMNTIRGMMAEEI